MTYKEFIDNILETRGRFSCGDEYHEKHHIVPRCMGGGNEEENLIDLYAREHFEAHRLLALENPDDYGLIYAWFRMSFGKNQDRITHIVTAEEYEEARTKVAQLTSLRFKGRKVSEETKIKMSQSQKGRPLSEEHRKKLSENHADFKGENSYWYGKNFSEEHRKKLSESHKGKCGLSGENSYMYGKHHSEETKRKISQALKGQSKSEETKNKMSVGQEKKPIMCLETGKVFVSATNVDKRQGISQADISSCCRGTRKTAGGYQWKYLYDQIQKDGTVIPGAITLGLITEEEALRMLEEQKEME